MDDVIAGGRLKDDAHDEPPTTLMVRVSRVDGGRQCGCEGAHQMMPAEAFFLTAIDIQYSARLDFLKKNQF